MKAPLLGLLAFSTLGLVGYAVYTLLAAEPVQPRSRAQNTALRQPIGPGPSLKGQGPQRGTPLTRIARAVQDEARTPRMPERPVDDQPIFEAPDDEAPTVEMPITRSAAEEGFDQLLTRLEEAEPEDLAKRERDDIYRDVNAAFMALSARLGDDDTELLEDSYQRMQAQMSRLKIKPPSFAVDPNADER